jgi:hypothetical protein
VHFVFSSERVENIAIPSLGRVLVGTAIPYRSEKAGQGITVCSNISYYRQGSSPRGVSTFGRATADGNQ